MQIIKSTHKKLSLALGSACLVMLSGATQADDIDIYYSGGGAGLPESEPMVMFSIDWRPNLGSTACSGTECDFLKTELDSNGNPFLPAQASYTYFDMLRAVLRKVMDPLEGLRIGLMLNHDYKNNCAGKVSAGCSNGGYIGIGFESFQAADANGAKANFHDFLDTIPTPLGVASHQYQGKELFFEFFRYLTGQRIWNGHVGFLDYTGYEESEGGGGPPAAGGPGGAGGGNPDNNLDVDNPSISWDTSIEAGPRYVSPLQAGGRCTKIFSVNVMFQNSQQDDNSDSQIEDTIANGGFGVGGMRQFPNVIEYMNDADLADGNYGSAADLEGKQNVTSYFIVPETNVNVTTRKYAQAGGTGEPLALSDDPEELVATLEDVFKQILSVSTTFVSASVPINAFNRAEIIDNVYIAMFKTDPDGKPQWTGNVKKLRIADTGDGTGDVELQDATNNTAIAADGRIRFDALTYWTNAADLPPADPDENEVDGKDGRSTTRGGTGQNIPGFVSGSPGLLNSSPGARTLYYDDGGSLAALNADVGTASTLQSSLGAASVAEAQELIAFARGLDVNDEDGDLDFTEARSWIQGDTLHSRPMPINFGASGGYSNSNQRIYIAYGANDGFMRMIRNTTVGGSQSGEEIWAFMPQSVMGELATLKPNAAGSGHPYLVDGTPSLYVEDRYIDPALVGSQDVYMYFGLRRGGKAYYALDITTPESPDLLWTIDKSGDFSELGMTFSNPEVGLMPDGADERPIVMFSGGYDTNKDTRPGVGTADTEGNAIYVVDGEDGTLIWKAVGSGLAGSDTFVHAGLVDSIPSSLTAIDTNGDGFTDRIYTGDSGGKVWRVDMHGEDTSNWKITLLANLGRHYSASQANDRRFFHRPDVVQSKDSSGPFDAVVLGSGNRADPLSVGGLVEDFVYMIKDRNIGLNAGVNSTLDHVDLGDVTNTCLQEGGPCTADLSDGWKMGLTDTGEKNLSSALTIGGTAYFSTYLPPGESEEADCGPDEGNGRFYAVKLANAAAVKNYDTTTEELERSRESDADGIPSEGVYIPSSTDSEAKVMHNDYSFDDAETSTRLRTFWLQTENGDL